MSRNQVVRFLRRASACEIDINTRVFSTSNPTRSSEASQSSQEWTQNASERNRSDFQRMIDRAWQEVKEAVLPKKEVQSITRVRTDVTPVNKAKYDGPTHIVRTKPRESLFSRMAKMLHKQFGNNPVYTRLLGIKNQGKEMAEDFKDRLESSDHPMVHRIQDYHESFTKEGEAAQVMREILKRDPDFKMDVFLKYVKEDVERVVKAYLEGDKEVLKQHCTDDLSEKLMGLYKHNEVQGTFQDSTLLFINDVEMMDAMFVDKQPVLVVTFSCQQINCMRDKFGNVVEGKEDEIQQVYYAWALQQDEHGAVDAGGKFLPPRWQLREMMIRGFHALI